MRILVDKDVAVPMGDGVSLATDVYRPDGDSPAPAILMRLPYDKAATLMVNSFFDVMRGVQAGYAVVVQDTRGRYASEGTFNPFADEAADGRDAIDWVASQPWATGAVGMVGASYFGATQWTAATQAPGALRAIVPAITTDQYYESWAYQGGAFQLGFNLHWALMSLAMGEATRRLARGEASSGGLEGAIAAVDANGELFEHLPLRGLAQLQGMAPYYDEWLDHPSYDDFWRASAPCESFGKITVPAFNIGGWYDLFLKGTLANYVGMKQYGGSEKARRYQRLLIGPWAHGNLTGHFPERSYGVMGGIDANDITAQQLRWFNWLLKDEDPAAAADKPVRVFVMGANVWRDEDDWPVPGTRYVDYFLHSDGRANSAHGDGRLSLTPPGDEPEDAYLYDPRRPVPTTGGPTFLPGLGVGANAGPRDQRRVEDRADVLCYTSEPLAEPLEVIGPLTVVLYVSSSAPDTDFTAKLVDVWPDGRAEGLADGIQRARYRSSRAEPELLEPGRIYEVTIDLVATANVFAPGHRLRLEVSSSNFPRFDRNTNTGGVIATEGAGDLRQALNRAHHRSTHPSHLVLPVVRG